MAQTIHGMSPRLCRRLHCDRYDRNRVRCSESSAAAGSFGPARIKVSPISSMHNLRMIGKLAGFRSLTPGCDLETNHLRKIKSRGGLLRRHVHLLDCCC
nr:hypothetical protein Itr_chr06CG18520 [Ipomoea trifida]